MPPFNKLHEEFEVLQSKFTDHGKFKEAVDSFEGGDLDKLEVWAITICKRLNKDK